VGGTSAPRRYSCAPPRQQTGVQLCKLRHTKSKYCSPECWHQFKIDERNRRLITTIDFDQRAFISLGRSTDKVTCSLDNPSISRLHALIVHHQRLQAFFLIDCDSAHGTYLAGKRVKAKVPVQITQGTTPGTTDPIKFGGSSRVYVLQASSVRPPALAC
jgi:hypothetical protein